MHTNARAHEINIVMLPSPTKTSVKLVLVKFKVIVEFDVTFAHMGLYTEKLLQEHGLFTSLQMRREGTVLNV